VASAAEAGEAERAPGVAAGEAARAASSAARPTTPVTRPDAARRPAEVRPETEARAGAARV
jgi:hypothetical protein